MNGGFLDWLLTTSATLIGESGLRQSVVDLLMTVPGLPPIVQSIHILGIAVVFAAFAVPHLKLLGIAAHGQRYSEMLIRLKPWGLGALTALLLSGTVFLIARPDRYLFNPVVGIKFGCLAFALTLTVIVQKRADALAPEVRALDRWLAGLSLVAWLGVIFAGRWIAYVDYLYWEE